MVQLLPFRVRRDAEMSSARLFLRSLDQQLGLTLCVPMAQARLLLSEMHGLSTDFCDHHHFAARLLQALSTRIGAVILREEESGWIGVAVQLQTPWGIEEARVEAGAALAVALHLGLPIYAPEDCLSIEGQPAAIRPVASTPDNASVPPAFRELIEGLELSADGEFGAW